MSSPSPLSVQSGKHIDTIVDNNENFVYALDKKTKAIVGVFAEVNGKLSILKNDMYDESTGTFADKNSWEKQKENIGKASRLVGVTDEMTKKQGSVPIDIQGLVGSSAELRDEQVQSMSVEELNAYEQLQWEKEARAEGLELSEERGDDGFKKVLEYKNSLKNTYFDIPEEAKPLYADFCESELGKKMHNSKGTEFFGISNVDVKHNAFSLAVGYSLGNENGKPVSLRSDFRITKNSSGEFEITTDNSFKEEEKREFFVKNEQGRVEVKTPFDSTKYLKSDGWEQNFAQDVEFDKNSGEFSENKKYKELYQSDMTKKSFENNDIIQENSYAIKNNEGVEIVDPYEASLKENSKLLQNNTNFYSSYSEGMKYANDQGKNVLVVGVGENCSHCKNLYDNVINTKKFMDEMENRGIIVIMKKSGGIYGKVENWSNTVPTTYFKQAGTSTLPRKIVTGEYDMKTYIGKITDNM